MYTSFCSIQSLIAKRSVVKKPNIIVILADDMGFGDVGCYGATKIPTPNMDKAADQGVHFTDVHSSSAVCTPSRYSVLTGRYCWRTWLQSGVLGGFGAPLIEPDRPTVASILKSSGYATAAVGKWHLGLRWRTKQGLELSPDPTGYTAWDENGFNIDYAQPVGGGPYDLGFDYWFGISGSLDMPPYCFIENNRCVGVVDREKEIYYNQQRKGLQADYWRDETVDIAFAQKSVAYIEAQAKCGQDKPFFLYLATAPPHRPCDIRPAFVKGKSSAGDRGDMVVLFDWVVGQVMEALDRTGVADHTLLIITSDNGGRAECADGENYGHKTNGDWRGQKADIWDGGHRIPFIARQPSTIAPGSSCDQIVCLTDLFATFGELAGETLPNNAAEDSISFASSITGGKSVAPARKCVVHHSLDGMFSVRKGRWKLVEGLGSGGFTPPKRQTPEPAGPEGQLYDMFADPRETTNLWLKKPQIVQELSGVLQASRESDSSRRLCNSDNTAK